MFNKVATRVAALAELLAERANGCVNGNSRYYSDGLQVADCVRLQQGRVTTRGGMSTLRAARSSGAASASSGMYDYDYYGGSGNDEPYDDGGGDYADDSDVVVSHFASVNCLNKFFTALYCVMQLQLNVIARCATKRNSSATLIAHPLYRKLILQYGSKQTLMCACAYKECQSNRKHCTHDVICSYLLNFKRLFTSAIDA
jgi:hypothetical protein